MVTSRLSGCACCHEFVLGEWLFSLHLPEVLKKTVPKACWFKAKKIMPEQVQ